ncbi:MAG: hypothetical protein JXB42_05655 [Deltaproteobacteria bacterium]|nr:hypothetical protein [Deltaproteobacteria bacterium]
MIPVAKEAHTEGFPSQPKISSITEIKEFITAMLPEALKTYKCLRD